MFHSIKGKTDKFMPLKDKKVSHSNPYSLSKQLFVNCLIEAPIDNHVFKHSLAV